MATLQKKKMEVSHKMKMETLDLRKNGCPAYKRVEENESCTKKRSNSPTLIISKCKQASKAAHVKASREQSMLSYTDSDQEQKGSAGPCKGDFCSLRASLDGVSISEPPIETSKDVLVKPGNGCLSSKKEEPFLLEQETSLPNLTVNEPMSLTNFSGHGSLLSLLNYFPQKDPHVCSRKKLLILDINGILADVVYPAPKGYMPDTKIAGRAVFTRPFCSDFLNFCLERFNVAIWSSRSRKIIDRLVNYLMGDMKHKLIFCWDLSHCTQSKFRTLENKHKAVVFKELKRVWERYDPDLPWEKGYFNESNTLLLDDSPYKALLNPPHSAIFPYSYNFEDQVDNALGPKGKLRAYLEELAVADDVQKYVEQHPFGQSAITESSLSWRFYDKVIKGHNAVPATR